MNNRREKIKHLLRKLHILQGVDHLRWVLAVLRNTISNRRFYRQHPGFCVPPSFLAYDAYGSVNWNAYYERGVDTAQALVAHFRKYNQDDNIAVLEWGCGPARVIRHVREMFPSARVCGTDYNRLSIQWAKENIPNIEFSLNELNPPLSFPDQTFDFIYVISVFTHLSESVGKSWMREMMRILKPGGVILFTTHCDTSAAALLPEEKQVYDREGVYVRGGG